MSEPVVTTRQIVEALRAEYPREKGWAVAEEVQDSVSGRRADFMAWNTWTGKVHVVEVKMSRSDARNDLDNPGKSAPLRGQVSAWWLACPPGIVGPDEAGDRGWGLMVVHPSGTVARAPGRRLEVVPSHGLATAFIRRLCADDSLEALLAEERAAGAASAKNKAARAKPGSTYTLQDIKNAEARGASEAWEKARAKIRKAEGALS